MRLELLGLLQPLLQQERPLVQQALELKGKLVFQELVPLLLLLLLELLLQDQPIIQLDHLRHQLLLMLLLLAQVLALLILLLPLY